MILEEETVLRPVYLPFSVAQPQAGVTAFQHVVGASAGRQCRSLRAAAACRRLSIPEGGTSLEEVERALVEMALRQANGNQTHAARLLDISRDALRYKLKKFGFARSEEEDSAAAEPGS